MCLHSIPYFKECRPNKKNIYKQYSVISVENSPKQNNIYLGILATLVVLYVFDLLKKKIRPYKSVNVHKSDSIGCVFHVCFVFVNLQ